MISSLIVDVHHIAKNIVAKNFQKRKTQISKVQKFYNAKDSSFRSCLFCICIILKISLLFYTCRNLDKSCRVRPQCIRICVEYELSFSHIKHVVKVHLL